MVKTAEGMQYIIMQSIWRV